jgi:hypothetical protein
MKRSSTMFALSALATATIALAQQAPSQTAAGAPASTAPQSQSPSATTSPSALSTGASNERKRTDPPNTLYVTLNMGPPVTVDIDESNHANEVNHSTTRQTITWKLKGNAASGTIVGFRWVSVPGPTDPPFGCFETALDGKQATMSDLHAPNDPTHEWVYQLSIQVGGQVYQTNAVLKGGNRTNTDPSIKNN